MLPTLLTFGIAKCQQLPVIPMKTFMYFNPSPKCFNRSGFTLVEIMVVVVIVGLLAVLALPAVKKAREGSYKSRLANDYRQFRSGFENYALANGDWPVDEGPGVLPPEMVGYINASTFEKRTLFDGQWDWEGPGAFSFVAGISLRNSLAGDEFMMRLDGLLDDGDLTTGSFRILDGTAYTYVMEE